jgi:hypothetical protein
LKSKKEQALQMQLTEEQQRWIKKMVTTTTTVGSKVQTTVRTTFTAIP